MSVMGKHIIAASESPVFPKPPLISVSEWPGWHIKFDRFATEIVKTNLSSIFFGCIFQDDLSI